MVVWDIIKDIEVSSFWAEGGYYLLKGPNTKTAFITYKQTYVNLDTGLPNHFFNYEFQPTYNSSNGYKLNSKENMILSSNCLIIKNTYLSAQSADIIRTGKHEISNESINFDRLKWQIDGNTVLHHFALDYERLSLILNYMEEKSPQYLSMILMTNKRGKTPLDITLDNESPKNTEALLRKLIIFKDHRLSQLYYKRFKDLFNMNITAFHDCLEACFFQTTQMKSIKYLKLRDKSLPVCVPHISAIIDETFVDKY